jgi:UDP-glucose 4-epimerase
MQTIVITGAAGYIGSHTIIELLTKTSYSLVAIDNFSNSNPNSYQRIKEITGKSFDILNLDVCDKIELDTKLGTYKNIVGIIHFAAFKSVPDSVANPVLYYHNNIVSLTNLLSFAKQNSIHNFIFSSSCSVYGNSSALPVTEQTPLQKAESPYGHTKQIGEDIIEFFCKVNPDFKAVLLRYFNPVGAHVSGKNGEVPIGKPNNLVPIITQTAVGKNTLTVFGNDYETHDGYCIRDFIHVSDVADAHLKAMDYLIAGRNKKNISLFNLGTGKGVSVLEAIHSFEKVSGLKLNYTVGARRGGDVMAVYADNSLAQKELAWFPKYTLDDMMLTAWKWQQNLDSI